ncbi:hypothetical protein ACFY20_44995 [Streptomyces sp. NPDC001312]|uniref:hypothetical protein n=1 Tax=Streptomyces sp. NPDC001312 TaxID=3364561 RepID=UPI0036A93816
MLGERLVDVVAQLLALVGFEGASVVGFIHRVEGQDDALHHSKDLLVAGIVKPSKLVLEGVEDCCAGPYRPGLTAKPTWHDPDTTKGRPGRKPLLS